MARSEAGRLTGGERAALRASRPRSLWRDAWRRLALNRGAMLGLVLFVAIIVMALAAPLLAPYDPVALNPVDSLLGPSARHWMGTDSFGRDILSRIIYGARVSVQMGFVAARFIFLNVVMDLVYVWLDPRIRYE